MSARTPWWYSGDESEPTPADAPAPDAPQPDAPGQESAGQDAGGRSGAGLDWSLLAFGAQRLVEWATERVVAPHAEHEDPSAHPDCLMCRAMATLPDPAAPSADERPAPAGDIAWIPIVEAPRAPSPSA